MVLISSTGLVPLAADAAQCAARVSNQRLHPHFEQQGMPHIASREPNCAGYAHFTEPFYVGELSGSALLNHISPSALCRTSPCAQLKGVLVIVVAFQYLYPYVNYRTCFALGCVGGFILIFPEPFVPKYE